MSSDDPLERFRPDEAYHTVISGETLSDIAEQHRTEWPTLARINGIIDPSQIAAGQRLRLPDTVGADSKHSALTPTTDSAQRSGAVGRTTPITADQIRSIMPNAGTRAETYVAALNAAMETHGITTVQQRAAFLAQIGVESGDLRNTAENLNYSAQRLTEVWPQRFPTVASALPYANNPEAFANRVYANRLGNGDAASNDGYAYRGRGLMQVTGRENYRALGFENNPEALADPQTAADTAAAFWQNNNLNAGTRTALNRNDFNAISRTVNGGDHGINERWTAYQRALSALKPSPASAP